MGDLKLTYLNSKYNSWNSTWTFSFSLFVLRTWSWENYVRISLSGADPFIRNWKSFNRLRNSPSCMKLARPIAFSQQNVTELLSRSEGFNPHFHLLFPCDPSQYYFSTFNFPIILREQYSLWSRSLCNFSRIPNISSLLHSSTIQLFPHFVP